MAKIQRISKFKVGDRVVLVAGGPVMAVEAVLGYPAAEEQDLVRCQWFGGKKLESGVFPTASLRTAPDEPGSK